MKSPVVKERREDTAHCKQYFIDEFLWVLFASPGRSGAVPLQEAEAFLARPNITTTSKYFALLLLSVAWLASLQVKQRLVTLQAIQRSPTDCSCPTARSQEVFAWLLWLAA